MCSLLLPLSSSTFFVVVFHHTYLFSPLLFRNRKSPLSTFITLYLSHSLSLHLSLSLSLSLSLTLFLSFLSFSLPLSLSPTHTLSISTSLSLSHSRILFLFLSRLFIQGCPVASPLAVLIWEYQQVVLARVSTVQAA